MKTAVIADIHGNLVARRKFAVIKKFLAFIGIEPERVQFSWVSASEGARFAALMHKVVEDVKRLGPAEIATVTAE